MSVSALWWGDQKVRDSLDRLEIRDVKMDIEEPGWMGGCGLDLAGSGRDNGRALVNAVINFRFT